MKFECKEDSCEISHCHQCGEHMVFNTLSLLCTSCNHNACFDARSSSHPFMNVLLSYQAGRTAPKESFRGQSGAD